MEMNRETTEEIKKINDAIDEFSEEIKKRMLDKFVQGYRGWDGNYDIRTIKHEINDDAYLLLNCNSDEQLSVDIGARAMMVWFRSSC
jgi:predicted secreted protein